MAERLVDDLHGAGIIGGSHKSQYVKWLLGRVRGNREGSVYKPGKEGWGSADDVYRRPYSRDTKRRPVAQSAPLDTEYAGWSPEDWEGKHEPFDAEKTQSRSRSRFIEALIPTRKKGVPKKKAVAPPAPRNEIVEFVVEAPVAAPQGKKYDYKSLDELIIKLKVDDDSRTTRDIVKIVKEKYGLDISQPTVSRRLKAFRDGKIDATGKTIR
ncbi:MAG: hypothetical protein EBR27_04385 [Betaproteobacteria bacterium]|nr:hypothetical protein [Betaproteobacteria bacterium]